MKENRDTPRFLVILRAVSDKKKKVQGSMKPGPLSTIGTALAGMAMHQVLGGGGGNIDLM